MNVDAAWLPPSVVNLAQTIYDDRAFDRLPSLAATEATNLTARWNSCATYWQALTGAATRPNSVHLRRIQLYGLQLTAAARLT